MEKTISELKTALELFGMPNQIICGNETLKEHVLIHVSCPIKVNSIKHRSEKLLLQYDGKNMTLPVSEEPLGTIEQAEPEDVHKITAAVRNRKRQV